MLRHKYFVFRAGLLTRAPVWRLVIHDWSKFSLVEWNAYVHRFFSGRAGTTDKSNDPDEFHRAWTHHWHVNAHHWEHWLAFKGDGSYEAMRMPEHFVMEMVADWCGAGRAITGKWGVAEWYAENRERITLHPYTRVMVDHEVADVSKLLTR